VDAPQDEKDLTRFLERFQIRASDIAPEKAHLVRIAVAEWSHQRNVGVWANKVFILVQVGAPVAAATATILAAFNGTSAWAVIPAAIATVAASLLAGLRSTWFLRRRLRHELAQDIIEFVTGSGAYRTLDLDGQIDLLMSKIRAVTTEAAPATAEA
jgi:hypothetical protein